MRYWRERMPIQVFGPVVGGTALMAVWAAQTPDLIVASRASVLVLLLVMQFRLWDDLEDAETDAVQHPERLLPRVPRGTFRATVTALGCSALLLASVAPASLRALLLLDGAFLVAYRIRRHLRDATWRYGLLLLKYPSFVAIVALASAASLRQERVLTAMAAVYACAAGYEYWHSDRRTRLSSAAAAPMRS